jgi:hypothetical protein
VAVEKRAVFFCLLFHSFGLSFYGSSQASIGSQIAFTEKYLHYQDEFSFKVENINLQQVQYLGGQLFSDGTVASVFGETTIKAAPIVLITPTTINLPYPPPLTLPTLLPTATQIPLPHP